MINSNTATIHVQNNNTFILINHPISPNSNLTNSEKSSFIHIEVTIRAGIKLRIKHENRGMCTYITV